MTAKNTPTPKTVADTASKKQNVEETAPVTEDVKIPNQTNAEPDVTGTDEEVKISLLEKAKTFVKNNRRTILFGASVISLALGIRSYKKTKDSSEETFEAEIVDDENNTDNNEA